VAKYKVKLNIADTIIQMQSDFKHEQFNKEEALAQASYRFSSFIYSGKKAPDILIDVKVVDKLPETPEAEQLFVTYHFQSGHENWRLLKKGKDYIYRSPTERKKQVLLVNENFDKATAYLEPKKKKGHVWNKTDIIYDFLQVLLIHYFALNNKGIFTHAIGVKDVGARGFLFAGKSGAGKTTTAKIWHKHSKAMVLNDDRVIVRRSAKRPDKFYICGSPWHGEFSDYLVSRIESAPLEKLFFIHHSKKNRARPAANKDAFSLLYPAIFPAFWSRDYLNNIACFCQDLISNTDCYRLGFVNDEKVIDFVRQV